MHLYEVLEKALYDILFWGQASPLIALFDAVPPPKIAYFTPFSSLELSVGLGFRPKIGWEMGFIPRPPTNSIRDLKHTQLQRFHV